MGPFFGAGSGQVIATTSPVSLINGLTVSQLITVSNSSVGPAIAYLHGPKQTSTTGFALEPGQVVVVDTNNSTATWNVSTDGATTRVSWVSSRLEY